MHKITKLLIMALTAVMALSLTAGAVSARNRVELRPSGAIRATSRGLRFSGGLATVTCDVTLEGSVNRLIAKVRGSAAGTLTRDTVTNCTSSIGGTATADALTERELGGPMTIGFGSITGTLPNITAGLLEVTGGFLIRISQPLFGVLAGCLYRGTIGGGSAENPVRTLRVLGNRVPLSVDLRLGTECSTEGELIGSFTISPTQTIALLER